MMIMLRGGDDPGSFTILSKLRADIMELVEN